MKETINSNYYYVDKFKTFLCIIYIFLSFYEGYLNKMFGSNTKYLLFIIIIIFFIGYRKVKFDKSHVLMICWLLFKISSISWAVSNTGNNMVGTHLLSQLGMVGFYLAMTCVLMKADFIKTIINSEQFFSTSLGLLGLFFSQTYNFTNEARQVLTLFGNQEDPNNLSALYIVGVVIGLYKLMKSKEHRVINVFSVLVGILAMLMTASRGGLVTLAVVLVCFIFLPSKSASFLSTIKKLFILLICLVALYFLAKHFVTLYSLNRIFEFDSYKGGSNRDILWKYAFDLIKQKPIFGWGWGGYAFDDSIGLASHNTYISMLCDIGIFGTMLFLIPVFIICKKSIAKRQPLAMLLLVAGLTPSFFIDAINKRFFWNAIIFATMIIKSNILENNE